ncbi:type II toxin-antitoxin system VapC family toxin [Vulcanococcus limneticus Candia 3F8]|uniref:type II toxin-antitoxin system VapC family toxin n=1 Tax=Vulcanococcus limneticus TaxID=2170428 RepID=UPI000B99CE23|nr:type II toxin-antitoxin system VapC family toxin [Vulcanococcus limneticus]MCP9793374.1 type II toxin-antitoxin system VapC family toxin [Vulcanococcus limneticus MW73D5]MCP9895392.1 type II toxin-antitoxin system VapC family toxin [Vulcanococcus limneticus Candia 3F8]MCP9898749.1 type II toxin-antitoxin system VapC family toxin [Vulcanococcus limneticus Candia 3B3]
MTTASGDFVLDASLSCAWCFGDEASAEVWALLARLQGAQAQVPSLWLWEIGNVLVQAERKGRITPAAIRIFLGLLETLPIHIDQATSATAWHDTQALARSHRLTTYDAAYLELALRLGLPLASRDQALNAAASKEGVPLLPS